MTCLRTYSPSEVTVSFALLYDLAGFAPDSLVIINRDREYFKTSIGASGGVERIHQPGSVYTVTITLAQTSPSNTLLSAIASLDDLSRFGVFPILIKDASGKTNFAAGSSWIESDPEVSFTNDIETREWTLKCSEVVFDIGGNGDSDLSEDAARIAAIAGQLGSLLE